MKTVQVLCDGCGRDLTTRSNIEDYRLVLSAESKPGHGPGAYTCMAISPPVDRAYHFCGLSCLDQWRSHEKHYGMILGRFWDKWKSDNGERLGGGIRSYPTPPTELHKQWRDEATTEADLAFPLNANARNASTGAGHG